MEKTLSFSTENIEPHLLIRAFHMQGFERPGCADEGAPTELAGRISGPTPAYSIQGGWPSLWALIDQKA
jgi:hypothetical protein